MGCCASKEQEKDKHPLIIDVQQTIADEAWRMFYFSKSRFRRLFLKRSDYTIEVPMNYYHFQEIKQTFNDVDIPIKASFDDFAGHTKPGNNKGKFGDKYHAQKEKADPGHIGLETDFKNSTGQPQTYSFKFEKTRKASTSVTYQRGFSIGGKTNFSVGLPKVLPSGKIGTEVDMHVTVTKTTGDTFENTLTTSATSEISVAKNSHYTASVVMEERMLEASFKVWVMMSMPAKEARAFIKNKQGQTIFFYKLRNLAELFPKETHIDEPEKNTKQKDKEDKQKDREDNKDSQVKDESKVRDASPKSKDTAVKETSPKVRDIPVRDTSPKHSPTKDTHTKDTPTKDTHAKDTSSKDKEDDKDSNLSEVKDTQVKDKKKKQKFRKDAVMFVVEGMVNGVQLASHRIQLTDHKSVDTAVQTK